MIYPLQGQALASLVVVGISVSLTDVSLYAYRVHHKP